MFIAHEEVLIKRGTRASGALEHAGGVRTWRHSAPKVAVV